MNKADMIEHHKSVCNTILRNRYLNFNEDSWDDLVKRMEQSCKIDLTAIHHKRFLPAGRILRGLNAEGRSNMLLNCFVLEVNDSMEEISNTLALSMKIFKDGGGIGYAFNLRPSGSRVQWSEGESSGPLPFMELYSKAIGTIQQGGGRRGAGLIGLNINHPDILNFIYAKCPIDIRGKAKEVDPAWKNVNISVFITKEFIEALEKKKNYELMWNGEEYATVSAESVLEELAKSAWLSGDPGIYNIINARKDDPDIVGVNPCGETGLPNQGACCLGSLVLPKYVVNGSVDFDMLSEDIKMAVEFLDHVLSVSSYYTPEMEEIAKRDRRIGLGVTGLGTMMNMLKAEGETLDYRDTQSNLFIDTLMGFIAGETKKASNGRNKVRMSVAPAGTITFIASLDFDGMISSSIEPVYDHYYYKWIRLNGVVQQTKIHSYELTTLMEDDGYTENGMETLTNRASVRYPVSKEVPPDQHIMIQKTVQKHVDNSVSKTINLPESSTIHDIYGIYRDTVLNTNLKGITVWRDQPLIGNQCSINGKECPTCE